MPQGRDEFPGRGAGQVESRSPLLGIPRRIALGCGVREPVDAAVRFVAEVRFIRVAPSGLEADRVGLCCTMMLYQSMNQTLPSGPISAAMGAVHSSLLARRFHEFRDRKPAPEGWIVNVAMRCPVGSVTNAVRFQYSRGYARAV